MSCGDVKIGEAFAKVAFSSIDDTRTDMHVRLPHIADALRVPVKGENLLVLPVADRKLVTDRDHTGRVIGV